MLRCVKQESTQLAKFSQEKKNAAVRLLSFFRWGVRRGNWSPPVTVDEWPLVAGLNGTWINKKRAWSFLNRQWPVTIVPSRENAGECIVVSCAVGCCCAAKNARKGGNRLLSRTSRQATERVFLCSSGSFRREEVNKQFSPLEETFFFRKVLQVFFFLSVCILLRMSFNRIAIRHLWKGERLGLGLGLGGVLGARWRMVLLQGSVLKVSRIRIYEEAGCSEWPILLIHSEYLSSSSFFFFFFAPRRFLQAYCHQAAHSGSSIW